MRNSLVKVIDFKNEKIINYTKDSKEYMQNYLKFFRNSPLLLQDAREKYALFKAAKFALAASGTAILELGMSGTPAAVFYKVGGFSAFIAKISGRLSFSTETTVQTI